jgi:hypothetical protein
MLLLNWRTPWWIPWGTRDKDGGLYEIKPKPGCPGRLPTSKGYVRILNRRDRIKSCRIPLAACGRRQNTKPKGKQSGAKEPGQGQAMRTLYIGSCCPSGHGQCIVKMPPIQMRFHDADERPTQPSIPRDMHTCDMSVPSLSHHQLGLTCETGRLQLS